ncbi:putative inner centromere protein, ARK-binding domain-containing protein [Tanacetum coccineum]
MGDLHDKGEESDGAYTSDKNFDECTNDEMANLGLETNENPVAGDVEYNSKVTQHDNIYATCEDNTSPSEVQSISDEENNPEESHSNKDQASSLKMQVEEDDLCHEGKESAAGVLSKSTSSPFILSAIKQGNTDSEDYMDLGSSKSKQSEAGMNLKLSDAKLNSANAYTWPMNQQRNNEDQPTCLSGSRDFRVHIQRDAILCDLEAPENDLHSLRESASIPSSEEIHASQSDDIEDEMTCKLPEETELVHELQAAEDVISWNLVISSLMDMREIGLAEKLFGEMSKRDVVSWMLMISGFLSVGRFVEARKCFDCMSMKDVQAWNTMISDGIEVPASVWGSMLGACRLHKEYELGKMVREKMLELEPLNSGAYMILTEMHLHSDNKNEVANIFFCMRDKGIKKQPGCSWIEVTSILEKSPVKVGLVNSTQELSYDMSPYQFDDDDDETDDKPTKKFIPSWCSSVA